MGTAESPQALKTTRINWISPISFGCYPILSRLTACPRMGATATRSSVTSPSFFDYIHFYLFNLKLETAYFELII